MSVVPHDRWMLVSTDMAHCPQPQVEIQTELEDVEEDEDEEMLASSFKTSVLDNDPLSKLVSEKVEGAEDSDDEEGSDAGSEVDIEDLSSEEGSASESDEDEEKL